MNFFFQVLWSTSRLADVVNGTSRVRCPLLPQQTFVERLDELILFVITKFGATNIYIKWEFAQALYCLQLCQVVLNKSGLARWQQISTLRSALEPNRCISSGVGVVGLSRSWWLFKAMSPARTLSPFKRGNGWPLPTYWLGKLRFFFLFLNYLIVTSKDEEVSHTDTSPFRTKVIPQLLTIAHSLVCTSVFICSLVSGQLVPSLAASWFSTNGASLEVCFFSLAYRSSTWVRLLLWLSQVPTRPWWSGSGRRSWSKTPTRHILMILAINSVAVTQAVLFGNCYNCLSAHFSVQ